MCTSPNLRPSTNFVPLLHATLAAATNSHNIDEAGSNEVHVHTTNIAYRRPVWNGLEEWLTFLPYISLSLSIYAHSPFHWFFFSLPYGASFSSIRHHICSTSSVANCNRYRLLLSIRWVVGLFVVIQMFLNRFRILAKAVVEIIVADRPLTFRERGLWQRYKKYRVYRLVLPTSLLIATQVGWE